MTGLLIITLFFSNVAFAYDFNEFENISNVKNDSISLSDNFDNINDNAINNNNINNNNNDADQVVPSQPFVCDLVSLTSTESTQIINKVGEGFIGEEVSSGKEPVLEGTSLEGLELVGPSRDGETAVKQAPPSEAVSAENFSLLSDRAVSGPFGVGIILDDTLRVGRCDDLDQEECRIYGEGLSLRTSGKGFITNTVNIFGSLGEKEVRDSIDLSDEELEKMRENFLDYNSDNFKTISIEPTDQIPNSFRVDRFNVVQSTNCTNAECMISTYSTFDKYFNAWYSFELVASNFGPTLLNGAKRLFQSTRRGDGTKLSGLNQKIDDLTQRIKDIPAKVRGLNRGTMYQERINQFGLGNEFKDLTINKGLFSTGAKGKIFNDVSTSSSLKNLTPVQKREYLRALEDLRAFARTSQKKVNKLADELKVAIQTGNRAEQHRIAQELAGEYKNWDDVLALDFPDWIKDSGNLSGFSQFNVRKNLGADGVGYINLAEEGAFNTTNILEEFANQGNWGRWSNTIDGKTFNAIPYDPVTGTGGGLRLFELKPSRTVQTAVSPDDLSRALGAHGTAGYNISVRNTGEVIPLTQTNIDLINRGTYSGTFDIVVADWAPKTRLNPATGVMEEIFLEPRQMAEILTQKRVYGRISTANRNLDDLYYGLRNKPEFNGGRSFGWLDQQLRKEEFFLKEYYTNFKVGGVTGTLKPIAFWQAKQGFGYEDFSAFMLPDTWSQIEIYQGNDRVFANSFVDFFANEGSDQGDLFRKVINMPIFVWNFIVTQAAETRSPVLSDLVSRLTGSSEGIYTEGFSLTTKNIMRDEVENIAFYSHNEDCPGCSADFTFLGDQLRVTVKAPSKIDAYIVEATPREIAEQKGSTLIAYSHRSNLRGSDGQVPGGEINLVAARNEGTTCEDAIRNTLIGFALPKSSTAGLVIGATESMFYFMGMGPGIIASLFMQLLITPDLQDCVDDKEGYYIHFYDPPPARGQAAQPKEIISSRNVSETFSNMSNDLKMTAMGGNPVATALDEISEEFQNFTNMVKRDNMLQARIDMLPPNFGSVIGKEIFYIWYKGNQVPTGLKIDGKQLVIDGNDSFEINFEDGSVSINDEKIINDKKEITGLVVNDTRTPATMIPKTVSTASAPNTTQTVFELNSIGEVYVREEKVIDCIRRAIEAQSGISYSGNELSVVFGDLVEMKTTNYEKVFVSGGEIHLEGSSPRAKGGALSKFIVDGFWNSRLSLDANRSIDAGRFSGVAFENGSIVVNKETNELVIWLRQHKNAILTNREVSGLNVKKTVTDGDEECPAPAIELEALGFANDEIGMQKVDNFNKSMQHLGPFTQFTTDSKIYQFYSVLDPITGECKDYFRVIDKDTGRIISDSEIVGGIIQDETGKLSFNTSDGKRHSLDFSAEGGVPKVSYNNAPAETLRTAQGPNGSFWYDPNTGQWFPENSIQIPLGESFKNSGISYGKGEDGRVSGTPVNPMTFNIGQQGGGAFNIPSIPQNFTMQLIFIMIFLGVAFYITRKEDELIVK